MNVFSSVIPSTSNVPLYPTSNVPAVLVVSVTFLTLIFSPTFKSCGSSVSIVTVVPETVALSINLKFLLTLNLVLAAGSNVVRVRSASSIAPVLLDS